MASSVVGPGKLQEHLSGKVRKECFKVKVINVVKYSYEVKKHKDQKVFGGIEIGHNNLVSVMV